MNIPFRKIRLKIHPQIFILLIIWSFTFAYFWQTRTLSFQAMLFPRFLFGGILISGLFVIRKSVTVVKRKDAGESEGVSFDPKLKRFAPAKELCLFCLAAVAAIVVFDKIHGLLAIGVFSFLLLLITGVRKKSILFAMPVVLVLFIYLLFVRWLSVPLPNIFQ